MNLCKVEGCSTKVRSKGFCEKHYCRIRRHGSPDIVKRATKKHTEEWILSHLDYGGDDCLKWPFGFFGSGYGRVQHKGKSTNASRLVCIYAHGEPEQDSMQAAHSCGNGHLGCVNPRHLRWASRVDNEADKVIHGTSPRGSKNAMAVLSDADVLELIRLFNSGKKMKFLADKFSVHYQTIYKILKRKRWSSITLGIKIRGTDYEL